MTVTPEVFDPERFEGAPIEETTITPEGWHEKKAFKDYAAFNEYRKSCENHGVSLDLLSIGISSGARGFPYSNRAPRALVLQAIYENSCYSLYQSLAYPNRSPVVPQR